MKVTEKAVETKTEKVLEISENELDKILKEVCTECMDSTSGAMKELQMKSAPELMLFQTINHAEFAARLHHRLFEDDKEEK